MKLFFAIWPDDAERAALAAWQPPLRECCGGRPMRLETLHSTLVFLGEVPGQRLPELIEVADAVGFRRFGLLLASAHYWGHNHIVYAAPEQMPEQLARLVGELEHGLRKRRFQIEERPYRSHVTLLRNAKWRDVPLPPMPAVRWQVDGFALVRSLSDEQGARYEVLARFPSPKEG